MADLFTLSSSGLPDDAALLDFRLTEAINTPYELVVHFVTKTPDDLDLADAIGAKATLVADRGLGGPSMQWGGVFAAIEHIHQANNIGIFTGLIVPRVWDLAFDEHSRIFTKMNVKEFATAVLQDAGLDSNDFEFRLNGSPSTEELVCQYKESDLAFITRWFEREGLYYFFEQGDDGPKMIVTDKKATDSLRMNAVPYYPTLGHDVSSGEAFQRFRATRRASVAKIKLRDYDYAKPALDVKGEATASKVGSREFSRFGDRFFTPSDGDRLAKVRADSALAKEEVYVGSGTPFQLRTGYLFELDQHPRAALNKKYFATKLEHRGVQSASLTADLAHFLGIDASEVYRVDVIEATDADLPYRAPRVTPWPHISGQEIATVDGPADGDHYAQLDDDGRYLVKFKFDENTHDDGKASTRVRMMQPHAGNPEGFHFPLRKGTEVVIIFLGGDPDRPIIAGAIPNAVTPSPITSKNHTRNMIITGSKNVIEIEDLKGKEWIDVYTPALKTDLHMGTAKDWKDMGKSPQTVQANYGEHTDGTAARSIGGDQYIDITGLLNEHVHGTVQEDYDNQVTQTYTGPKTQTVTNLVTENFNSGQTTNVKPHHELQITGTRLDHITGDLTENYDSKQTQTVGGARDCTWSTSAYHHGPSLTETFDTIHTTANTTWTIDSPTSITHLGNWTLTAGTVGWQTGAMTWSAPSVTLTIPSWTNTAADWFTTGGKTGTCYNFQLTMAQIAIGVFTCQIQLAPINVGLYPSINVTLQNFVLQNNGFHLCVGDADVNTKGVMAFV